MSPHLWPPPKFYVQTTKLQMLQDATMKHKIQIHSEAPPDSQSLSVTIYSLHQGVMKAQPLSLQKKMTKQ